MSGGSKTTTQSVDPATRAMGVSNYNRALGVANSPFTPFDPSSISQFESPYTQQVIDAGTGDLNRARQMTINGNHGQATLDNTFGGNRGAVTDSMTNDDFLRAVAAFTANTRNQGFQNAEQTAMTNWQAQYQDPFLKQGLLNQSFGGSVLPTATTTKKESSPFDWGGFLSTLGGDAFKAIGGGSSPFGG